MTYCHARLLVWLFQHFFIYFFNVLVMNCSSFPLLERPLAVSEGAQIFNLGLDDVCALVEASGRTVANKIFEGFPGSIPFPGNFYFRNFFSFANFPFVYFCLF